MLPGLGQAFVLSVSWVLLSAEQQLNTGLDSVPSVMPEV